MQIEMLSRVLLATCIFGGSFALSEKEWKDAAITVFAKETKYINMQDYDKYGGQFADDVELLWPGLPLDKKDRLMPDFETIRRQHPFVFLYIGPVELLYSSPDTAIVRLVGFGEDRDGKGIVQLVGDENGIRIKMYAYNYS